MKKVKLRSSLLVGAVSLLFAFPGLQKGDLTDIAKPYLGVYECVEANFGEEDLLGGFDGVTLELKDKGSFVLYYKEKGKKKRKVKGKYRYDKESETITLRLQDIRIIRRAFPLKKGILTVTVPYKDKILKLQFEQK